MVPGGVHLFITDDDWQWMMNINALGTMHMMQAAATRWDYSVEAVRAGAALLRLSRPPVGPSR